MVAELILNHFLFAGGFKRRDIEVIRIIDSEMRNVEISFNDQTNISIKRNDYAFNSHKIIMETAIANSLEILQCHI